MLGQNRKHGDPEYYGLIPWKILNSGHVLKQRHHKKNVEARAKKMVVGAEYLPRGLPNSLNVRRFLYILLKDVVGLVRV